MQRLRHREVPEKRREGCESEMHDGIVPRYLRRLVQIARGRSIPGERMGSGVQHKNNGMPLYNDGPVGGIEPVRNRPALDA